MSPTYKSFIPLLKQSLASVPLQTQFICVNGLRARTQEMALLLVIDITLLGCFGALVFIDITLLGCFGALVLMAKVEIWEEMALLLVIDITLLGCFGALVLMTTGKI